MNRTSGLFIQHRRTTRFQQDRLANENAGSIDSHLIKATAGFSINDCGLWVDPNIAYRHDHSL